MPGHVVWQLASACCHDINKTCMLVLARWVFSCFTWQVVFIQNIVSCLCDLSNISVYAWQTFKRNPPLTLFGCRANRAGLTAWMHSGVQLLMDMLLKCYTLKGVPSLSKSAIVQSVHGFSLCVSINTCNALPACLPAYALMPCQTF